jgi:hypothetical protein
MKKIKLKESDLTRIIERVISEQDTYTPMPEVGGPEIDEIEAEHVAIMEKLKELESRIEKLEKPDSDKGKALDFYAK